MIAYYTQSEVAERLDVTRHTLWRWRKEDKGPPWTKVGRTVVYPKDAFERYVKRPLDGQHDESEADASA
jgi:excisionase family DNA binding protein